MEVTNAPVEWDEVEDREIWRQFLLTRTGQRLIPKLIESVPHLLHKGEINEILIRSGEVIGWQKSVQILLSLSVPEPTVPEGPSTAYGSLTDDAQWSDGQKLGAGAPK